MNKKSLPFPDTTAPNSTSAPTEKTTGIPVNIIIYSDFECVSCEKLHSEVEPEIKRLCVSTGKANIEMRLLGDESSDSMRTAEAALCAADQGKFQEYEDALFKAWLENDADAFSKEELIILAGSFGLDEEAIRSGLDTGSKKAELDKNMSIAKADGVRTLPDVIINGTKVEGRKPLDTYVNLIEQALKNQNF